MVDININVDLIILIIILVFFGVFLLLIIISIVQWMKNRRQNESSVEDNDTSV